MGGERGGVVREMGRVVTWDAVVVAVGASRRADYASVIQDTFGGRAQVDRPEVEADKLRYGRLFLDGDASQAFVPIGVLEPKESMHFRYLAAVHTPGTWPTPRAFAPAWDA